MPCLSASTPKRDKGRRSLGAPARPLAAPKSRISRSAQHFWPPGATTIDGYLRCVQPTPTVATPPRSAAREAPEQPVTGDSSELERKEWTAAMVSLDMLFEVVATSGSGIFIDSFHLARRLCSKACWPCSWSRSGLRCVRRVRGGIVAPLSPKYSPICDIVCVMTDERAPPLSRGHLCAWRRATLRPSWPTL